MTSLMQQRDITIRLQEQLTELVLTLQLLQHAKLPETLMIMHM